MNILEKIKSLFKTKTNDVKETSTTISLYDIHDVIIPEYNDLNNDDKDKVIKYKSNINITNLENIINFNKDISKEGEYLSKLLIKYLYELHEIIRKDDKTEIQLQEISINTIIKNMQVIVLKERIENLLYNCYLRAIAIEEYKKEYIKKENKFIEFFSHAAKIKRNMELKSLNEAEIRSKITIKTITQQLGAIKNAITANNILIDKMNIYNNLINNIKKNSIRKEIYNKKINDFKEIADVLGWNFSKLTELQNLEDVELSRENETKIIKLLAITEIELEKYILDNKDKMISYYINKILELKDIVITPENKNNILEEAEKLTTIVKVFNQYISDEYKEKTYEIIFNVLTFDINKKTDIYSSIPLYISVNDEEINHYIKIISDKINNINQGISPFAKELKKYGKLRKMVKQLNKYFKTVDGKYKYTDILFRRDLLALLLAFDSEKKFNNFFNEYVFSTRSKEVKDSIILPWQNLEWDKYLPLKTIYALYETDGKEKPIFYDIYSIYHKETLNEELMRPPKIEKESDYYYLPKELKSIDCNYKNTVDEDNIINSIRRKSNNKIVVFPSSLESINGDIFGNVVIKNIILNKKLKYIGYNVFKNQEFSKISLPASIERIEDTSFNFNKIKEIEFQDFKNSKLLNNLLYSNNEWVKKLIKKIFRQSYSEDYRPYIECSLSKIVLCDDDNIIELTKSDILNCINYNVVNLNNNVDRIQYNLSRLIEQKTGINIKQYQEIQENYKKK